MVPGGYCDSNWTSLTRNQLESWGQWLEQESWFKFDSSSDSFYCVGLLAYFFYLSLSHHPERPWRLSRSHPSDWWQEDRWYQKVGLKGKGRLLFSFAQNLDLCLKISWDLSKNDSKFPTGSHDRHALWLMSQVTGLLLLCNMELKALGFLWNSNYHPSYISVLLSSQAVFFNQ